MQFLFDNGGDKMRKRPLFNATVTRFRSESAVEIWLVCSSDDARYELTLARRGIESFVGSQEAMVGKRGSNGAKPDV